VNDELENVWKEEVVAQFRYYSSISGGTVGDHENLRIASFFVKI
jgi:hypothetical protein